MGVFVDDSVKSDIKIADSMVNHKPEDTMTIITRSISVVTV